jgi:pSer/pThr/pTyr-binding forkhead associated (FHA) protein
VEETSTVGVVLNGDSESIPANAFLILDGAQVYPLTQGVVNIGRRPDNHLVFEDGRVSRVHAQLRAIKGHFVIFDLDSSGGTFVNGSRTGQATLFPGDVISLAGVNLVYGQEAGFNSDGHAGGTQPIVPFPSQGSD